MLGTLRDKRREQVQFRCSPMLPLIIIFSALFWLSMAFIAAKYLDLI